MFKAKKSNTTTSSNMNKQDAMEAGIYPCRLVQLIDLGLQPQRAFQGQEKPPAHTIYTTYEFTDEFCVDKDGNEMEEKPRWLSEDFPFYSLDADLAKCTKRYKALDPKLVHDGDWEEVLGGAVNVTITAKEGKDGVTRNYIASTSAMRPRDAEKTEDLKNPARIFSLEDPDMEVYNALPKWLQEKIASNLEFHGSKLEELLSGNAPAPKKEPKIKPKAAPTENNPKEADFDEDLPW